MVFKTGLIKERGSYLMYEFMYPTALVIYVTMDDLNAVSNLLYDDNGRCRQQTFVHRDQQAYRVNYKSQAVVTNYLRHHAFLVTFLRLMAYGWSHRVTT